MFLVDFLRDWARGRTANSLSLSSLSPLLTYQRGDWDSIVCFFVVVVFVFCLTFGHKLSAEQIMLASQGS